ncbi:unnamed protein product [Leptosia nina]|uniref:Beta-glucosidase n=1 Tax=Leptosia nina TaxID=320188 RepID=A0AAV1IWG0_9NEOP
MKFIILSFLFLSCYALPKQERKFPDDFLFGTATASYQIEGAWDADGKGENIWDRMTHTKPDVIRDKSNGDEAADSYHNYIRDLVLANARAYHLYDHEFRASQGGECGITISVNWFGALTDSEEDLYAAEIRRQAEWGLYAEPIFSEDGGFPKEFSEIVARKSKEQGYPRSRMPEFTQDERELAKGSADFFGVNHYTAFLTSANKYKQSYSGPSLYADMDSGSYVPPEWPKAASSWLTQAPNSIYNVLTHLNNKYNNPALYITENGWSTTLEAGLEDDDRIKYYRAALNSVLDALEEGVNLKGYMAWSLIDNFEWMEGYLERFGLYQVDFESPEKTRTPRKAAFVYKEIIRSRVIDPNFEPATRTMSIDEGN